MVMVPTPDGPLMAAHDRAWLVLIAGLIITGAVVSYIQASRRHALRMTRVNQKFSDLAQTDTLTALPNRRAFMKSIHAAFAAANRGAKPFAVLYFDLDHFKDVNDTLGHAVGDALLRQVAARVRGAIRENDIVARFGGDEFAILQSDVGELDAAGALAAKIGQIVAEPYNIDGNIVHISASIGISRYAAEVAGPEAMMIQADLALYRAKEDGRNCYRFHSATLDSQVQERVLIADDLRGAHLRNELELYYQPQVELRSGRIIGLEALLRWNHPKRGQIPPLLFIPIAERSGQIQILGQWVLDAACRQLRTWQDEGIAPALVGVNFSAIHFKASTDLDGEVAACLRQMGHRAEPDRDRAHRNRADGHHPTAQRTLRAAAAARRPNRHRRFRHRLFVAELSGELSDQSRQDRAGTGGGRRYRYAQRRRGARRHRARAGARHRDHRRGRRDRRPGEIPAVGGLRVRPGLSLRLAGQPPARQRPLLRHGIDQAGAQNVAARRKQRGLIGLRLRRKRPENKAILHVRRGLFAGPRGG